MDIINTPIIEDRHRNRNTVFKGRAFYSIIKQKDRYRLAKKQSREKSNTTVEKAVALKYNQEEDTSPRVVAKGEGHVARQIRAVAEEYGIPIRHDDDLVELLAQVDIDREIPEELYAAVAEILSWIYRANEEMRKGIVT